MNKPLPVFFLVGPTAVGKSAVAVELAILLNAEIISCDAMQVYREAAVASDKPSSEMRGRVRHHLIDVVSVADEFNAARYRELALAAIADIHGRGKVPLIAGGSGMYMMVLLDGIFEDGGVDPAVRARLEGHAADDLYAELKCVDPAAAARISPNDKKRVMRALEVFETTGVPISAQQKKRDGIWGKYDIRIIGLERPREELYSRLEARVDEMFVRGLVDEVRALCAGALSSTGSQIIGVPEVRGFIHGEYGIDQARDLIKLHTRHYVKRQMTWFRKDKRIEWLMVGSDEGPQDVAGRVLKMMTS